MNVIYRCSGTGSFLMNSYEACRAIDMILDSFELKDFEGIGYEGSTPYQILISTILSQQTTERNSRKASERLFVECPGPKEVYDTPAERIEELVFSSGYYRQKARCIKDVTRKIVEEFGGEVPCDPDELMKLPGVGKKTAACVMRYGFGRPSVIVDTHINRVAQRLGISDSKRPDETQRAIVATVPQDRWDDMDVAFIALGRTYCRPSEPKCSDCPVSGLCRFCDRSEPVQCDRIRPLPEERFLIALVYLVALIQMPQQQRGIHLVEPVVVEGL